MINPQFFSVTEMIAINGRNRPNAIALQTSSEAVTWQNFDCLVNAAANALIGAGVNRGEPIALLIDSSIWSWIQVFGVLRAGGVITPLNTMLSPEALLALLVDSKATHLIVSANWNGLAGQVLDRKIAAEHFPVLLAQDASLPSSLDLPKLVAGAPKIPPTVVLRDQDPSNIIYSSGTTAQPKGIVHTHGARTATAAMLAVTFRCSATTRTLLTTPPHTNGSFMVLLPTIWVGGTVYISGGFNPDRYLDEVRDFRPTLAFMVPTMAQALVSNPKSRQIDWGSFDFIVTAGAPMPSELKRLTREMTGNRLGELWGFTEGVATVIQPHEMEERPASVGRPIGQCEVRIVDSGDSEVEPGVVGELVGRSAMMMAGYHMRPDADRDVIWRSPDGKEFLRTGDLGVKDADGWITIKGRKKDMLISGGLNIYPCDIEAVVLTHESVLDCTVIGVPHLKWGETPVAFVIPKTGCEIDADKLKAWVNERVGRHQRIHDVVLTDAFPRNTLGKVMKFQIAESYGTARL